MNHSKTMPATGLSIAARPLVAIALAGLLAAGCGSSEDKAAPEVVKTAADPAAAKVAQAAADASDAAATEAEKYEHMANAVVTSKSAGTGMGLAISRTIVESHEGKLWAEANPGRGATFHFTLPAARLDLPAGAPAA